jgi:hypothetical protein
VADLIHENPTERALVDRRMAEAEAIITWPLVRFAAVG